MKMKRAGLLAGSALLALTPLGMPVAAWTIGAVAVAGATSVIGMPAFAAGGNGGGGAIGGQAPGQAGADALTSAGGGGGGAAGGGLGGAGSDIFGLPATVGGQTPGEDGADGKSAGGGGGAGGAHGYDDTLSGGLSPFDNSVTVQGGDGGKGGTSFSALGGGGGGEGGYGAVVSNTGASSNTGQVLGGAGGDGGAAEDKGAVGGGGGDGGIGIYFSGPAASFINSGDVRGGLGGNGGEDLSGGGDAGDGGIGVEFSAGGEILNTGTITGGSAGSAGNFINAKGGVGIEGAGLTITNDGQISGGLNGDGSRASAIRFTGGSNNLILESNSEITGAVDATNGKNDTLTLGGKADGSFDVSAIGQQYQNFESFTVDAHAAWTLTGTTKETTNWVISSGILQVSDDASLGAASSTVTLDGNATFRALADMSLSHDMNVTDVSDFDTGTHTVTMDGQLSGTGQLNKFGTGVLILNADSSGYAAPIAIGFGTLMVGDASHSGAAVGGDVNLAPNGTLAGYGTVGGDVNNVSGGVVAPGGLGNTDADIGTLRVAGDYAQSSGSTLRILMTPNGASKLAVTGMAHLGDGALNLVYAPGKYSHATHTVVEADGGIDSVFDGITETGGKFASVVDFSDTNKVTVTLEDGSSGSGGGTVEVAPENGQVMGAAVNTAVMGAQVSTQALFGHLNDRRLGTTDDSLRTAFAGSNPNQVAFAGDLAELNAVLAELPQALAQNGGWFRATGGFGSIDGNNGAPGLDSYGGGFMAGYDRQVTDTLLLGAAVGFSRTQINQDDGSSASVNTPRLTLYGSYEVQRFALDLSLGYGFDRIKMRNQSAGGTAKSAHDAHELVAAMQMGYAIDLPSSVVLTPKVGVDYLHLFEDGYKESGAGAFDLEAKSSDTDSLKPHVGVSVAKTFTTDNGWNLTPEVSLTYSREMLDDSHQAQVLVGGGSFTVEGVKLTRDELALGTELTAQMSQTFELFGGYTAILPIGNTVSHNFEAGLRASF